MSAKSEAFKFITTVIHEQGEANDRLSSGVERMLAVSATNPMQRVNDQLEQCAGELEKSARN